MAYILIPLCGIGLVLALLWVRRHLPEVRREKARELFRLQLGRMEEIFLTAVRSLGKPRGLTWKSCTLQGELVLVSERRTRELVGLMLLQAEFEAVPGGDMEDNPNVEHPRSGTAVFHFSKGTWRTDGRMLMNVDPAAAIALFDNEYERL